MHNSHLQDSPISLYLAKISIFSFSIIVFFGYMIQDPISYVLYIITLITAISALLLQNSRHYVIPYNIVLWVILFVYILLSGMIIFPNAVFYRKIFMVAIVIASVYCLQSIEFSWERSLFLYITTFGSLHVIATITQLINPIIIDSINMQILTPEQLDINRSIHDRNGFCAGITGQTGTNAYIIALTIIVSIGNWMHTSGRKRILLSILLLISFLALLITGKRTITFAVAVAIMLMLFINYRWIQRVNFQVLKFGLPIIAIITLIILFVPAAQDSFLRYFNGSTSGRDIINSYLFAAFKENPIFGNGYAWWRDTSDNNYLLFLCENGIIGFTLFLIAVLVPFIHTIYSLRKLRFTYDYYKPHTTLALIISFAWQLCCIIYSTTGNPYNYIYQLLCSLLLCSVGMRAISNLSRATGRN